MKLLRKVLWGGGKKKIESTPTNKGNTIPNKDQDGERELQGKALGKMLFKRPARGGGAFDNWGIIITSRLYRQREKRILE